MNLGAGLQEFPCKPAPVSLLHPNVILSDAKDLMHGSAVGEILRFAQDDIDGAIGTDKRKYHRLNRLPGRGFGPVGAAGACWG